MSWIENSGLGSSQVTDSHYRGDFLVRAATTCVARYGTIADARTLQPVSGATVTLGSKPLA